MAEGDLAVSVADQRGDDVDRPQVGEPDDHAGILLAEGPDQFRDRAFRDVRRRADVEPAARQSRDIDE
ncbi:hypothetical protein Pd630_LPD07274 [Rhodococcus opacus PD630]|nr:hypothetical protein Pd630_LPD07274 [Rhodococcus opacus PD630]